METKALTIDAALAAIAAETLTDEQVKAIIPRSSWAGYELPYGGPEAEMKAYWRVLNGWPKDAPAATYTPAFASEREASAFYAGQEKALED